MIFREATEKDYPAIVEFHKSQKWGIDTLSAVRNFHNLNSIIVCEIDSRIVGKIDLMQKTKAGSSFLYIERLIIHPDFRHKGIAKKFLEYAEAECKKRNLGTVELSVREDNVAAITLYISQGFKILGKKVYMQKQISNQQQANNSNC